MKRKNNIKRLSAILLVATLAIGLVGCGKSKDGKNESKGGLLIGLLYDMGQDASTKPIQDAKDFLDKEGIDYKEYTGTTVDEVSLAVDSAINDKVDAIFTPTDNTIMTAELTIYEKLADAGIPHYTGADSFALNGAFLGYGVDYAMLGQDTADMVKEVLIDKKDISSLPVVRFDNGTATINTEICEKLGIDFDTYKETIKDYCQEIKEIQTSEEFDDPNKDNPASSLKSHPIGDLESKKTFKIGICNYVDDASLNQIVSNIKVRLDEIGKEAKVKFEIEYDNANADSNVMNQIISDFNADKVDLMIGVATPVAMAMQSATEDTKTPVLFAAVSDPLGTELVQDLDNPGANISGTSDYLDTISIMKLMVAALKK